MTTPPDLDEEKFNCNCHEIAAQIATLEADAAALAQKHDAVTTMVSRYLVASKGHVSDSWLDGFIECGAVTIDTSYPTGFIAPVKAATNSGKNLLERVSRYEKALREIKDVTRPEHSPMPSIAFVYSTAEQALQPEQGSEVGVKPPAAPCP